MIEKNVIAKKGRLFGTALPIGALRGAESTGVGEFLDLIDFASLCADMGISLIQILPVNDTGYESSPYSALTAFALHPLYIRLNALEEAASFIKEIEVLGRQFAQENRFPYNKVLRAKMDLLRRIYNTYRPVIEEDAKSGALFRWIEENPWVKTYAVFRRLKEANEEKSWKEWSLYRQVSPGDIQFLWEDPVLRGEHLFWAWLQKALDRQFSRAAKAIRDMGLFLEGDIPILMNEDSCDVWASPDIFRAELSAGAPPDMYSPAGQNWGFPIYNWEFQSQDNFSWWKARLKTASRYYDAYRIDHVLGFFRIWASSRFDDSSTLGRYIPYVPVTKEDLESIGFNGERIRWFSLPHVPTGEVWDGIRNNWGGTTSSGEIAAEAGRVFDLALDRIGNEELWLFKKNIRGEKDIRSLGFRPPAEGALIRLWHNRLFYEYDGGEFFPVWYYRESRAYKSLAGDERAAVEELLARRKTESERIWESEGLRFLSVLAESSPMLPCAEDLGAVPDCVPRVLAALNILGLRVIRWTRRWDQPDQPYVPFSEYPELSVCTPSVHDSSTLREWWDTEADQEAFAGFLGVPSLPRVYNPGTAKIILRHAAAAASRFRVFQIQDLLHLSQRWYAADPAGERINIPGTTGEFNWTYRLPASIEEIRSDADLLQAIRELAAIEPVKK
ncbi:MAG: 4-alpha-glucanotransferase [Spirochaetaceae bacterium]|jgi:4-alpha-glucanotransferase|nr:4-alpha-glucanotransferase [Spirochaetaceae bacterium]